MFRVIRIIDIPFSSTPPEETIVGSCSKLADLRDVIDGILLDDFARYEISETLMPAAVLPTAPSSKLMPAELSRAIEAWNAMCGRVTATLPRVKRGEQYIGTYRGWKRKNNARTYVLEAVVAAAERAVWTHEWIQFGWLLGKKDGTFNCEKLLHDQSPERGRGRRARGAATDAEQFNVTEK